MAFVKERGLFFMRGMIFFITLSLSLGFSRKTVIKLATLAPEGTEWHGMLLSMGQEWKKYLKNLLI